MNTRNREIVNLREQGRIPVLSFELDIIGDRLSELGAIQAENARLSAQAVAQSSETTHDNSPLDAVLEAAKITANQGRSLRADVDQAIEFPYPSYEMGAIITLGSLATYLVDSTRIATILLTGRTFGRKLPSGIYANLDKNTLLVSLRSPVGEALLGLSEGEETQVTLNSKVSTILVQEVLVPELISY